MLKINNQEYSLISAEIKLTNATCNKIKGYSPVVILKFEHNNIKGYIDIYFRDVYKDIDFNVLINKIIKTTPTDFEVEIDCIEIFDTNNFIDFIDSEIILEFKNIVNNNLETKLIIDDDLIKVEYEGELRLVY